MSFAQYKAKIEEGDTVIVYIGYGDIFPVLVKSGSITQTKYGAMRHDWLIGSQYGTKFQCSTGYVYILHPTPELWTMSLPHRTQILYSTDIAVITLELELKPGSIVCESGTGSGSLSHAILRTVSPTGYLHTVEFHEKRAEMARKEFTDHGFGDSVTVYHRDVIEEGFPIENEADAVFLDIPRPYDAVRHAIKALKTGGRLCSFSPCIEQVQRTCLALSESKCFEDVETIELIHKPYKVRKNNLPVVNIGLDDLDVRRILCKEKQILPCPYEVGDRLHVGTVATPSDINGISSIPPCKRKKADTSSKHCVDKDQCTPKPEESVKSDINPPNQTLEKSGSRQRSAPTPPSFTGNAFSCKSLMAPKEIYGHTGYLTFATYNQPLKEQ